MSEKPLQILTLQVKDYLTRMNLSPTQGEDGLFLFRRGSTVVMVSLFEKDELTFVRFASTLLQDFEITSELVMKILDLNTEVLFGSFLLLGEATLSFSATILGNNLDFPEFQHTLEYVAKISDDYDDVLQEMAGGKRAEDILRGE